MDWLMLVRQHWPLTPQEAGARAEQEKATARRLLEEKVAQQRQSEADAKQQQEKAAAQEAAKRKTEADFAAEQQRAIEEKEQREKAYAEARHLAEVEESQKLIEMLAEQAKREREQQQQAVQTQLAAEATARREAEEWANAQLAYEKAQVQAAADRQAAQRSAAEDWAAKQFANEQAQKNKLDAYASPGVYGVACGGAPPCSQPAYASPAAPVSRPEQTETAALEVSSLPPRLPPLPGCRAAVVPVESSSQSFIQGGAIESSSQPFMDGLPNSASWKAFVPGFLDSVRPHVSRAAFDVLCQHAQQPAALGTSNYLAAYEDDVVVWEALKVAKLPMHVMSTIPKSLIDNKHGLLIVKHLARHSLHDAQTLRALYPGRRHNSGLVMDDRNFNPSAPMNLRWELH